MRKYLIQALIRCLWNMGGSVGDIFAISQFFHPLSGLWVLLPVALIAILTFSIDLTKSISIENWQKKILHVHGVKSRELVKQYRSIHLPLNIADAFITGISTFGSIFGLLLLRNVFADNVWTFFSPNVNALLLGAVFGLLGLIMVVVTANFIWQGRQKADALVLGLEKKTTSCSDTKINN
jgi:hypothetical protein